MDRCISADVGKACKVKKKHRFFPGKTVCRVGEVWIGNQPEERFEVKLSGRVRKYPVFIRRILGDLVFAA